MPALSLSDWTHVRSEIISAVLAAREEGDLRAFVFTPNDPLPKRRIEYADPNRRYDDHSSARWVQDAPTFAKVKRVANWGWLRRIACGYWTPGLAHWGTFEVVQWRYGKARPLYAGSAYVDRERFDPILIARLSDGRVFADQWADPSVLFDSMSRWRNASGYVCHWSGIGFSVTGAVGGLDWNTIPGHIAEHRARVMRERRLAEERTETYVHPLDVVAEVSS